MLSRPLSPTRQMGQNFSVNSEGGLIDTGQGGTEAVMGDNSVQRDGIPGVQLNSGRVSGVDGGSMMDNPCVKDKIDNLIENYLLEPDEKKFAEQSRNNSVATWKAADLEKKLLELQPLTVGNVNSHSKCDDIVKEQTASASSALSVPTETISIPNESLSVSSEDVASIPVEKPEESSQSADVTQISPSSKSVEKCTDNDSVSPDVEIVEESGLQPSDNSSREHVTIDKTEEGTVETDKSKTKEGSSNASSQGQNNITTFQTLIEKVLDNSLQNVGQSQQEKTNILDLYEMSTATATADYSAKKNTGNEQSSSDSAKLADLQLMDSEKQTLESANQRAQEDMSISKRKQMCLKDHIERVLEKSFATNKPDKDTTSSRHVPNDTEKTQTQTQDVDDSVSVIESKSTAVKQTSDNSNVNAQSVVDTVVVDQTNDANTIIISPSKEVSNQNQVQGGQNSSVPQIENMHNLIMRQIHKTFSESFDEEKEKQKNSTEMNKALMQGMVRLQNHLEETVSNFSKKMKEIPPKEAENWCEQHSAPHNTIPHENRRQVQDKSPSCPERFPTSHQHSERPLPTANKGFPAQFSCANTINNTQTTAYHNVYSGIVPAAQNSRSNLNQLSPRHVSPRQMSPRQPPPSSVSPISGKSPGSQHLHYGVQHCSNQISLRDCQCASCDSRMGRKLEHVVPQNLEYGAMKPGHISNGSPYHSGSLVKGQSISGPPPHILPVATKSVIHYDRSEEAPQVSSAMALGPTPPPLMYFQNQSRFKVPQLYPSNPPISSSREYVHGMSENMSRQQVPQTGHFTHGVREGEPKSRETVPGNSHHSQPSIFKGIQHQQQQLGHVQYSSSSSSLSSPSLASLIREREESHRKQEQYNTPIQPTETAPVLDLSVKKKYDDKPPQQPNPPQPAASKGADDAPLDLSVKLPTPKSSNVVVDHTSQGHLNANNSHSLFVAPQDRRISGATGAFIHQLENSVDKLSHEHKSPAMTSAYHRAADGGFSHNQHSSFTQERPVAKQHYSFERSQEQRYDLGHQVHGQNLQEKAPGQRMTEGIRGYRPEYSGNSQKKLPEGVPHYAQPSIRGPPQPALLISGPEAQHGLLQSHIGIENPGHPGQLLHASQSLHVGQHNQAHHHPQHQTHSPHLPSPSQPHMPSASQSLMHSPQVSQYQAAHVSQGSHHQPHHQSSHPSHPHSHPHPSSQSYNSSSHLPSHPSLKLSSHFQHGNQSQQQGQYVNQSQHTPQLPHSSPSLAHPQHLQHSSQPSPHLSHTSQPSPHLQHSSQPSPHLSHTSQPSPHLPHGSQPAQHLPHSSQTAQHLPHGSQTAPHLPHRNPPQAHPQVKPPHGNVAQTHPSHLQPGNSAQVNQQHLQHVNQSQPSPHIPGTNPPSQTLQAPHGNSPQGHPSHHQQANPAQTLAHFQHGTSQLQQAQHLQNVNPSSHTPSHASQQSPSTLAIRQDSNSPDNDSPTHLAAKRANISRHEPIQNIIGNHQPNDILYLICRMCGQTYGSPYGFRKHFRNQHGFEPRAEHTFVQTISATKTALQGPVPGHPVSPRLQQGPNLQQQQQQQQEHLTIPREPPPLIQVGLPVSQLMPKVMNPPHAVSNYNIAAERVKTVPKQDMKKEMLSANGSRATKVIPDDKGMMGLNASSPKDQSTHVKSPFKDDIKPLTIKSEVKQEITHENVLNTSTSPSSEKKCMECPECGQTFQLNDFGLFKRHCRQHGNSKTSTPFISSENSSFGSDQVSSSRDNISVNSGDTICKYCSIPFATPFFLMDHIAHVHPDKVKSEPSQSVNSTNTPPSEVVQLKSQVPQVTKAVTESITVTASPDSSCEPLVSRDADHLPDSSDDREMPVLKKQVSCTSSSTSESCLPSKPDIDSKSPSVSSKTSEINVQENTDISDEKLLDFDDVPEVNYMHKKFSGIRKRKSCVSDVDINNAKNAKIHTDGSVNSPSAQSCASFDSENSTLHDSVCGEMVDGEVGQNDQDMDTSELSEKQKILMKMKCNIVDSKPVARHNLPFVWDRVTRSQAGKNVKLPKYH